jgi:hypothetical protein
MTRQREARLYAEGIPVAPLQVVGGRCGTCGGGVVAEPDRWVCLSCGLERVPERCRPWLAGRHP